MAILADATDEHRSYWWERYRIRVHPYATTAIPAGGRDHSLLLELLRRLVKARMHSVTAPASAAVLVNPSLIQGPRRKKATPLGLGATVVGDPAALVRYAARLIRPEQ